jgi:hypothetical protein
VTCNREDPGSRPGPDTNSYAVLCNPSRWMPYEIPCKGHARFLPHPFQFIRHTHPTIWRYTCMDMSAVSCHQSCARHYTWGNVNVSPTNSDHSDPYFYIPWIRLTQLSSGITFHCYFTFSVAMTTLFQGEDTHMQKHQLLFCGYFAWLSESISSSSSYVPLLLLFRDAFVSQLRGIMVPVCPFNDLWTKRFQ